MHACRKSSAYTLQLLLLAVGAQKGSLIVNSWTMLQVQRRVFSLSSPSIQTTIKSYRLCIPLLLSFFFPIHANDAGLSGLRWPDNEIHGEAGERHYRMEIIMQTRWLSGLRIWSALALADNYIVWLGRREATAIIGTITLLLFSLLHYYYAASFLDLDSCCVLIPIITRESGLRFFLLSLIKHEVLCDTFCYFFFLQ